MFLFFVSLMTVVTALVDLSDTLIFERDGASYVISGLPESKEVNPPGFWILENPPFPNLANPNFLGKCLCFNHGPNPSYFPPPPWRSDVVGVVAVDGVLTIAFSSDLEDSLPPKEAIRFPTKLQKVGTDYLPVPDAPLCECLDKIELPLNDASEALNTKDYPLNKHRLLFRSNEHIIEPVK
eukprot:NODE_8556_length_667_cov_63.376838_g7931_i0.p1 GENE.NODE_8556_length_667_cov_63.376838_g7931_i0~~NODE_8556_length_667_cov_63.376838_g7931_i0.p1  ORF type:complete len:181 (+),score=22.23 NODE_8556_length_667_cov_63.376838_g7931_i0:57-599(+)